MYRPAFVPIHPDAIERPAGHGEALFREGDPCDYVFELCGGIARGVSFMASGERQISAFFFPGDQIGLPVAESYRFTAEAVTDVRYVCHSRARWHESLVRSWREEGRLLPSICAEQDPIFRRGIIIGRHGLLVRLCAFFISVIDRLPEEDGMIVYPLSQVDVAAYLATSPESVCRGLRQLREMRVIAAPERERMVVLDRARLEAIASGAHS
ncbi:MAG: helix-turn-helix domain-containing protein [Novosphingobium sp.]|nr:helix-turn-helix domain-containing protein [Novosphingobium sp.]